MTMDRMVEYLENRGFKVEKKYNAAYKRYEFSIFKYGIEAHKNFEYPSYARNTPEMDKIQVEFLESLIRDWESANAAIEDCCGRDVADYIRTDIDITKNIYRNMVNSIYGVHRDRTVNEVFNTLNEEQRSLVYQLVGKAIHENSCSVSTPKIKDVIFNCPATIVFWSDGTKTVVKCQEGDTFDPEKGLAMAISKKVLGNNFSSYNVFKKWLKKANRVEV